MASWDFALVEQRFAEAALDPSRWVTALEAVTAATESFGTVLIPNTGGLLPTCRLQSRWNLRQMSTFAKVGIYATNEITALKSCGSAGSLMTWIYQRRSH